jgi:hypothetical protein
LIGDAGDLAAEHRPQGISIVGNEANAPIDVRNSRSQIEPNDPPCEKRVRSSDRLRRTRVPLWNSPPIAHWRHPGHATRIELVDRDDV